MAFQVRFPSLHPIASSTPPFRLFIIIIICTLDSYGLSRPDCSGTGASGTVGSPVVIKQSQRWRRMGARDSCVRALERRRYLRLNLPLSGDLRATSFLCLDRYRRTTSGGSRRTRSHASQSEDKPAIATLDDSATGSQPVIGDQIVSIPSGQRDEVAATISPFRNFSTASSLDSSVAGPSSTDWAASTPSLKRNLPLLSPESVPTGENLTFGDNNFVKYEDAGVRVARNAAFVLFADGLDERLGYNGTKVDLPSESCTGTCSLQLYIESILALQEASNKLVEGESVKEIPLAIMTSDDTHSHTLALLESNAYFGMKSTQVTLLKLEKVACLHDNDARLALDPENKNRIQTKAHGHGDVHSLLYSTGTLNVWHDAGVKYVLFFQDTDRLLFKAIPAALGVSSINQYQVNSLAVPRKEKEYSPFSGNINQLIFELGSYMEELKKTGGAIKEFVNLKYKDATKAEFESSKVGFTVMSHGHITHGGLREVGDGTED